MTTRTTRIEQWLEDNFDQTVHGMDGSCEVIEITPKFENTPPCPSDSEPINWRSTLSGAMAILIVAIAATVVTAT